MKFVNALGLNYSSNIIEKLCESANEFVKDMKEKKGYKINEETKAALY